MAQIRDRDACYCNMKVFLLFLVILGHWMEAFTEFSAWADNLYRLIYAVHMPLFVFLSGFFMCSAEQAAAQARRSLLCYLLLQTAAAAGFLLVGGNVPLFTPVWHLWYLLSLSQWAVVCMWMNGKGRSAKWPVWAWIGILLLAVGLGCMCGCLPWVGRKLSLSRTLVFLPYLLAGQFFRQKGLGERLRGKRGLGTAFLAGFVLVYILCGNYIPAPFFYQAQGYGEIGAARGICMRLACYLMGALAGAGIFAWMPDRRYFFSQAGTDTMGIYLGHAPVVSALRSLPMQPQAAVWAGPAVSVWILFLLYRLSGWRRQLYAVRGRSPEGRDKANDLSTVV